MANYVALGALIMQLAFLAVVLSVVGLAVRKLIYAVLESRREQRNREQALVAAARARANARRQAAS